MKVNKYGEILEILFIEILNMYIRFIVNSLKFFLNWLKGEKCFLERWVLGGSC